MPLRHDQDNTLLRSVRPNIVQSIRAYRVADQTWGVFSLNRLARTPEFRQAAA